MNGSPFILWVRGCIQLILNLLGLTALLWILIWMGVFWLWLDGFYWAKFIELKQYIWATRDDDLRSWFFVYGSALLAFQFALIIGLLLNARFKRNHDLFSRGARLENHF